MTARDWVDLVLAILLTINLLVLGSAVAVALRRVSALSDKIDGAIADIRRDSTAALQETHVALTRLAELTSSLDTLVKQDVAPTMQVTRSALTHVDTTLKGVADATQAVRRITAGAEALTTPSAVSDAVGKMVGGTGGRAALIAGVALAVLRSISAMRRSRRAEAQPEPQAH
jgi:hypothetical protein